MTQLSGKSEGLRVGQGLSGEGFAQVRGVD
jgi:hypothetical protein